MHNISDGDRVLLESFHDEYSKDENLQSSLLHYLAEKGIDLPSNVKFYPGIDFVGVYVHDLCVLMVSLPPISNYIVDETEHTDKYLRKPAQVAV